LATIRVGSRCSAFCADYGCVVDSQLPRSTLPNPTTTFFTNVAIARSLPLVSRTTCASSYGPISISRLLCRAELPNPTKLLRTLSTVNDRRSEHTRRQQGFEILKSNIHIPHHCNAYAAQTQMPQETTSTFTVAMLSSTSVLVSMCSPDLIVHERQSTTGQLRIHDAAIICTESGTSASHTDCSQHLRRFFAPR